jgi:hypothetical protein
MNQFDEQDHPDDSKVPAHDEGIGEEISATGTRIKGAAKDIAGEMTGDEALEDKVSQSLPPAIRTGRASRCNRRPAGPECC